MSNNQSVIFKYIFTYDYNPAYVNGAQGGVSPRGDLVVNFYLERPPLPNQITYGINPNGSIGAETAVEPEDLAQSIVRYVPSGIVLNYQTARDLHQWLGEKIGEMEEIERQKALMSARPQEGSDGVH